LISNPNHVGSITGDLRDTHNDNRLIIYTSNSYSLDGNDDDWIIIDEAHERNNDLLLANNLKKLKDNSDKKPKVIITSASFKPSEYVKYFTGLKILLAEVEGVEPEYGPRNFLKEDVDNYIEKIVEIIYNDILPVNKTDKHNILVFLPSVATVKSLHGLLEMKLKDSRENIVDLYRGHIDVAEIKPRGTANIILATNVAETGITFDNLKYVIDSGWTNNSYYYPESDVNMLLKERLTNNMALQRWGRSGRSFVDPSDEAGPKIQGVIYCLYTEEFYNDSIKDYEGLPSVLTDKNDKFALETIATKGLRLMNDIPPQIRERNIESLYLLWAIDEKREITSIGHSMLRLGLEPRWAKIVLASIANDCVYPIVASISFMMTNTSIRGMPKMFNYNFSDQWEYWLLFKKYFQSQGLTEVANRFILIMRSLEKLGYKLENKIEDSDELWARFKQCLYSGLYMNMARLSDIENGVYVSNLNPEVIGRVSNSVVFTRDVSGAFPKKIVFDSATFSYNALGQPEYKFLNATRAD